MFFLFLIERDQVNDLIDSALSEHVINLYTGQIYKLNTLIPRLGCSSWGGQAIIWIERYAERGKYCYCCYTKLGLGFFIVISFITYVINTMYFVLEKIIKESKFHQMRFLSCGVGQMRSNISEIDRIYGSGFENILLPII